MHHRFGIHCRPMEPGVAFDGRRFVFTTQRWLCVAHDRANGDVGWAAVPGSVEDARAVCRRWAAVQEREHPLRGRAPNPWAPDWRGMVDLSKAEQFFPEQIGEGTEISPRERKRIRRQLDKVEPVTRRAKRERRRPEVPLGAILETRKALDKYEDETPPGKNKRPGLAHLRKQWQSEMRGHGNQVADQKRIEKLRDRGALFAVSHSGGKDSQAMLARIREIVPDEQIVVVHAPLLGVEWDGIMDQVNRYLPEQLKPVLLAPAVDKEGQEKWLLEWVLRRKYWPDSARRWCTAEFKRGPIRKAVRRYADENGYSIIVDAVGLRAEESPTRLARPVLEPLEGEHGKQPRDRSLPKREWYKWHPIKWLSTEEVFGTIEDAGQEPIWTYAEGMQRASCAFCVLASNDDLRVAARLAPDLYAAYVAVEEVVDDYWRDEDARWAEYEEAYEQYLEDLDAYKKNERSSRPKEPRKPPKCHTMKGACRRLEDVIGVKADRKEVNRVKKHIARTGELREITHAGARPSSSTRRRGRSLPITTQEAVTDAQVGFDFA